MTTTQPRRRRGPCAICDHTNQTTKLCAACRADPANTGWSEAWEGIEFTDDLDAVRTSGERLTLADVMGEPPMDLAQQIIALHLGEDQAERDVGGRFRRTRLSSRQIAARVGCSQQFAAKVIGRFGSGTVRRA